ncbi:6-phosphogluconolactonase [Microcella sp.]|uniref:6-phosphogluconolactonase n=1 Tax=Microcella sp. TaxID=1913979 RepID=UPI00299F58D6|nr:6-phosphogluconolactonase [Microcella sp.]MDX2026114.1 6-phosphogluconolactonase [Microcella sp.]
MTTERRVLVHSNREALAGSVAARFLTKMIDLLEDQSEAHVVLTGGSVGIEVLAAISAHPGRDQIDWSRVHLWWGDERWVPAGHADRNEQQAREALIDHIDIPASNVHAFPASDQGVDLESAAVQYQNELLAAGNGSYPSFAITFLGVGPDGHIASLFPESEGPRVTHSGVIAVHDSPKPPPQRLTLTLPLINTSERIWLVLAGADKAAALGLALAGAAVADVPVGGVLGTKRTVFFIDHEASSEVPETLIAPTSYWTGAMDHAEWMAAE